MKHRRFIKDNHKRFLYKKTEVLQTVLKVLNLYKTSKFTYSLTLRKLFCSMLVKDTFKSQVKNYCIITGRSRGIFRKVRVSRISFRKLGSEGLFFGLKKAS
jgi:small subunit ribosomal protein S14